MAQWKVLYRHKVCDRCLEFGHYWRDCSTKNPRCSSCNMAHHPNILCRPTETISTYPDEKVPSYPDDQWQFGPERPNSVQGLTLLTQSFSRTCPVNLTYPKSGRSTEGLAIIDDQATLSFVDPNAIATLDIDRMDKTPHAHTTATINGIAPPRQCLKIKGLVIKPLSDDAPIKLDSALTQKLPNAIQEIPTAEEVSSIPGLSHLSPKFPTKQNWPTILLIGRDCMKAQQQSNLTWSKDESRLAVKTPLGWAIMGKPAQSTRPLQKERYLKPITPTPLYYDKKPPPPQPHLPTSYQKPTTKTPQLLTWNPQSAIPNQRSAKRQGPKERNRKSSQTPKPITSRKVLRRKVPRHSR